MALNCASAADDGNPCRDDSIGDVVLAYERLVCGDIKHVSRITLGTDRVTFLQVEGIEHRDVSCSLQSGLSGDFNLIDVDS